MRVVGGQHPASAEVTEWRTGWIQLTSSLTLSLRGDRFSFLSLKSQDDSKGLPLFLSMPLPQTSGTEERQWGDEQV